MSLPIAQLTHPGTLSDGVVEVRPWRDHDSTAVAEAQRWAPEEAGAWLSRQQARPASIGVSCAVAEPGQAAVGYIGLIRRPRVETGVRQELEDGTLAYNAHRQIAGIGYWIAQDRQGQGIATRAVTLLCEWALTNGGLKRIEALMDPLNLASRRVAEKAGFSAEGQLRAYLELDDRYTDALVYSLLDTDLAGTPLRRSPPD